MQFQLCKEITYYWTIESESDIMVCDFRVRTYMYRLDSRIRYSETDEEGFLTMTGIINYFQDCSTFQSEDCGAGLEFLKNEHRAWLVSSWRIIAGSASRLGTG